MAGVLGMLVPYTTDKSFVDWLVMIEAVAQPVDLEGLQLTLSDGFSLVASDRYELKPSV